MHLILNGSVKLKLYCFYYSSTLCSYFSSLCFISLRLCNLQPLHLLLLLMIALKRKMFHVLLSLLFFVVFSLLTTPGPTYRYGLVSLSFSFLRFRTENYCVLFLPCYFCLCLYLFFCSFCSCYCSCFCELTKQNEWSVSFHRHSITKSPSPYERMWSLHTYTYRCAYVCMHVNTCTFIKWGLSTSEGIASSSSSVFLPLIGFQIRFYWSKMWEDKRTDWEAGFKDKNKRPVSYHLWIFRLYFTTCLLSKFFSFFYLFNSFLFSTSCTLRKRAFHISFWNLETVSINCIYYVVVPPPKLYY